MLSLHKFLISSFVFFCVINSCLFKELPSYIQVCKRNPDTLDDCVINSINSLRETLSSGIHELGVPSLDPLFIKEIKILTADNTPIRATGRNVKVTGASSFVIESLSVDPDTLKIKVLVHFPVLHFEGEYHIDIRFIIPLAGKGRLVADAINCNAELTIHSQTYVKDGKEYLQFEKIDADINIKDYKLKLEGLFNGDNPLGQAANYAINLNRGEILKATKPHLEKTVEEQLLAISNQFVKGLTLGEVLPP